jgi:hypothetical protein
MKNNIITYSDLKCPSVQLKCVLEDLFCSLINNPGCLNFEMALSPAPSNILTVTVGGVTHTVNLSAYLDNVKIQEFTLNDITGLVTIKETVGGNTWTINLSNAIKNLETNTSVINAIVGHKIADYSNEDGVLFPINETITTSSKTNANTLRITNEAGTNTDHTLISTNTLTVNANNDLVSTINGIASAPIDISAAIRAEETTTTITNTKAGNKIADYTNEDTTVVAINETITVSSKPSSNVIRITDEAGVNTDHTLIDSNSLSLNANNDLISTINGVASAALDLNSVIKAEETTTTVTNTVTGHKIADYSNEDGVVVALNETVTALGTPTLTGTTLTIPFTNESGVIQTVNVSLANLVTVDINVDNLTYNASSNIITLTETDGTVKTIDLSEFSIVSTTNPDGSITVTQEGVTKFTIPKPEVVTTITGTITGHKIADYNNEAGITVTLNESITTVDSLAVIGSNIVLKSTNETGTQSQVSMPVVDVCSVCSTCFEAGNTLSYTNANKPFTGTSGQIIYVTDVTANDGSMGSAMIWQVSTNSWKKLMIS